MSKETIKRKIAALRAKTQAAGCTEAEAIAAAALAAKLMQEHGINEGDIELVMARARVAVSMPRWQRNLVFVICKATNTHAISCMGDIREIEFAGKEHAVEIALYLRDTLTRAVNAELSKLRKSVPYRRLRKATSKSDMTASFAYGMVSRLSDKLRELFAGTINADECAAAVKALQTKYEDIRTKPSPRFTLRNGQAYFAGARAGEAVKLSHGVEVKITAPLMIGGA